MPKPLHPSGPLTKGQLPKTLRSLLNSANAADSEIRQRSRFSIKRLLERWNRPARVPVRGEVLSKALRTLRPSEPMERAIGAWAMETYASDPDAGELFKLLGLLRPSIGEPLFEQWLSQRSTEDPVWVESVRWWIHPFVWARGYLHTLPKELPFTYRLRWMRRTERDEIRWLRWLQRLYRRRFGRVPPLFETAIASVRTHTRNWKEGHARSTAFNRQAGKWKRLSTEDRLRIYSRGGTEEFRKFVSDRTAPKALAKAIVKMLDEEPLGAHASPNDAELFLTMEIPAHHPRVKALLRYLRDLGYLKVLERKVFHGNRHDRRGAAHLLGRVDLPGVEALRLKALRHWRDRDPFVTSYLFYAYRYSKGSRMWDWCYRSPLFATRWSMLDSGFSNKALRDPDPMIRRQAKDMKREQSTGDLSLRYSFHQLFTGFFEQWLDRQGKDDFSVRDLKEFRRLLAPCTHDGISEALRACATIFHDARNSKAALRQLGHAKEYANLRKNILKALSPASPVRRLSAQDRLGLFFDQSASSESEARKRFRSLSEAVRRRLL